MSIDMYDEIEYPSFSDYILSKCTLEILEKPSELQRIFIMNNKGIISKSNIEWNIHLIESQNSLNSVMFMAEEFIIFADLIL